MKISDFKTHTKFYVNEYLKLFYILIIIVLILIIKSKKKKRIGVVSLANSQNIGNILLKYAIFTKLSELGFEPYIVGRRIKRHDISLLLQTTNVRIINDNFSEIKQNEFDILMVNSDQTWRRWNKDFYDIAFLQFAYNWTIPKFVYAASLGFDIWNFTKEDENIAKVLIKNFTGISVREIGSVKLIKDHLGIEFQFVLDPTLLIDKKYYLYLIKDFRINGIVEQNYIFVYSVTNSIELKSYLRMVSKKYKIYFINTKVRNNIKKFVYGIYHCKAVITDSFHGTIFSIIFNKPFISFVYTIKGKERFNSLKYIFNLDNRIFDYKSRPDIEILDKPLNLNRDLLEKLKKESIDYLKTNLNIKK